MRAGVEPGVDTRGAWQPRLKSVQESWTEQSAHVAKFNIEQYEYQTLQESSSSSQHLQPPQCTEYLH